MGRSAPTDTYLADSIARNNVLLLLLPLLLLLLLPSVLGYDCCMSLASTGTRTNCAKEDGGDATDDVVAVVVAVVVETKRMSSSDGVVTFTHTTTTRSPHDTARGYVTTIVHPAASELVVVTATDVGVMLFTVQVNCEGFQRGGRVT